MRLTSPNRPTGFQARSPVLAALLVWTCVLGCGVEARDEGGDHTVFREFLGGHPGGAPARSPDEVASWSWPEGEHAHAFVDVAGLGTIQIELFPELAPATVANFEELASSGFYDGTTFHRVIPDFMIQGGDPQTKNDDPSDDGQGGPGYTIADEFNDAPHLRGAVAMANTGSPDSAGSQFFIVHADSPLLDGQYTLFGRVVSGMGVVDAITRVETDSDGRWGPRSRPIESIEMTRIWVAPPGTADAFAGALEPASPHL